MRPSDWFLVELPGDPVPGDAFGIRGLAAKYASIASIAGDASDGVTRARSSGAASSWIGDAGDIFREKSRRMPGELAKANDSYSVVAAALKTWADAVDDTQAQADRGLQHAREAHADLVSATAALDQAHATWSTVHAQQLTYQRLQKDYASVPPPPGVALPTPDEVRSNTRAVTQSQTSITTAHLRIADADTRLAAARALVLDAKTRRDDAERHAVHQIGEAEDRAVKASSVWEAIQDSAAWQTLIAIATVVITIVSILAIFIGGPLVWALILAATILLVVNALLSIAQGKVAWGELALLAIGLIPGGRLLGLAARGLEGAGRVGAAVLKVGELVSRLKSSAREGLQTVVRRLADDTGELNLSAFTRRSPRETQFSQESVSHHKIDRVTGTHYTYDDLVESMRTRGWQGDPIDVVDLGEHGVTSVDNTRLLAARATDTELHVVTHHPQEMLVDPELVRRFTPRGSATSPNTWGDAVHMRIQNQDPRWSAANPHGSNDTPRITGRDK